jgi:hypothetical protein
MADGIASNSIKQDSFQNLPIPSSYTSLKYTSSRRCMRFAFWKRTKILPGWRTKLCQTLRGVGRTGSFRSAQGPRHRRSHSLVRLARQPRQLRSGGSILKPAGATVRRTGDIFFIVDFLPSAVVQTINFLSGSSWQLPRC